MTIVDLAYPGRWTVMAELRKRFSALSKLKSEAEDQETCSDARVPRTNASRLRLSPELAHRIYLSREDYRTCIR